MRKCTAMKRMAANGRTTQCNIKAQQGICIYLIAAQEQEVYLAAPSGTAEERLEPT